VSEPEVIDLPRAVWEGEFTIFGVVLRCAVLDNGQRVINGEDCARLFAVMASEEETTLDHSELERFARWQRER
jgi:hypothetical protein